MLSLPGLTAPVVLANHIAEHYATGQITGGIGEALIATMCGLAIAILALIPFNYFTRKHAQLQFELESAATNLDVMVTAAKKRGYDTMEFRREGDKRVNA